MHVAVLGGGLQGCFVALALTAKGVNVTLIDRNERLLTRAAIANEGKIHLGYMYCADASLATARMMMSGALDFAPFVRRYVGLDPEAMPASTPTIYCVHRQSLRPGHEIAAYFAAVHDLLQAARSGRERAYFGIDLHPPRPLSAAERNADFDGHVIVDAFVTPEISIDPVALATSVAGRICANPRIECLLNRTVTAVDDDRGALTVISRGDEGEVRERYDHVVNALWDGRLAIDATLGFRPQRQWLNRFRYGIRVRPSPGRPRPPTATFVLGAFGESVNCTDDSLYLMWYPTVLVAKSSELVPPDFPMYPDAKLRSALLKGTVDGLASVITSLRGVDPEEFSEVTVRGGVIVAWGSSDIDDPHSELHQRFEIGVTSSGRYHSIDPGKLTMTARFAEQCANRICGL